MDHIHSNTIEDVRTPGRHLSLEERGMIQALHRQGFPFNIIAAVGCAHTTVFYELRERQIGKTSTVVPLSIWQSAVRRKLMQRIARTPGSLVKSIMTTASCLSNGWWNESAKNAGHWMPALAMPDKISYLREQIPIPRRSTTCFGPTNFHCHSSVPQVLKHKRRRKWVRKNKRMKGRSIEERPAVVDDGTEMGHWEVDTVVGRRAGREAVVFTAVEKVTRNYIAIRIPGRTCAGVEAALAQLQERYGAEYFSQIFKTMTADNGPEFENLSQFESLGTKIYFTHPYSSWKGLRTNIQ